jgi:RNA methyltransferase, TrmH family
LTKADARRLRELVRDRKARDDAGVFVCEGPRVVSAALEQHAKLLECFYSADASDEAVAVAHLCRDAGIRTVKIDGKPGDTKRPQGVFALAPLERRGREALMPADLVLVATQVNDPGNAGTLIRSAAAAGAQVVVLGAGSVDAYNPKVVRATAGACFAVRIVEGVPAMEILDALGAAGVRRLGAVAHGGDAPEAADLQNPVALVLGHETHGLDADLPLDGRVSIPMGAGESLNLAMAGSVLLFEAARLRRSA